MNWMIYGANGFTGELIAREAVRRGMAPILAGRTAAKLAPLAQALGLTVRAFPAGAAKLDDVALVLNCAGPFSRTAAPMMQACLAAGAHYLDITGEIAVLDSVHALDAAAKAAGVVLCPGVGFDVVPTDCVAAMLGEALPAAAALVLGFDAGQAMSPGTAKTMVEHAGEGGRVRRGGKIVPHRTGTGAITMDFGRGKVPAMPVPWGDVASAWYTTGIPDITVYTPAPLPLRLGMRALAWAARSAAVTGWLTRQIEARVKGPDEAARANSPAYVYGRVTAATGEMREMRIKTLNGYALTVVSALAVVEHLLAGTPVTGALTPARLMGAPFVLSLPGTAKI